MRRRSRLILCLLVVGALPCADAHAFSSADVAAVQVGLRAHGFYAGNVDGVSGPGTARGIRALQRAAGLTVDGIVGPATRHALGRIGRHPYGSRSLSAGSVGFDVAALQFKLESHGFPLGTVDGGFGSHTVAALIKFQRSAGLTADGVAGPATFAALSGPPPSAPFALRRPIAAPIGDPYGPRGSGWHPGIDFPAPTGTAVTAAAYGRVIEAGWDTGGYGNLVVIAHGSSTVTMYAHLSSIAVRVGEVVGAGALVGRVGSTGFATGPHLHFEVRVRGAAVNPLPALG